MDGYGCRVPSLLIKSVMTESNCGDEWVAKNWNTEAVLIIVVHQCLYQGYGIGHHVCNNHGPVCVPGDEILGKNIMRTIEDVIIRVH